MRSISNFASHLERLFHELCLLDRALFVNAACVEKTLDLRAFKAIDESLQRSFHKIPVPFSAIVATR